jgi:class 3 adenylate cyclase/tetratricopeptide (TPR) repeat protein
MKCPKCQFENEEGARFCSSCGQRLELLCPECGKSSKSGSRFCNACGHRLEEVPAVKTPIPPIDSERKHVTVIFSDISGYTAMTEKLDPEEVKEITGRVFGEISKIVATYEGFIEKFIGDAVMALFGVPQSHEDDPVRAIRAAREIHEVVSSLSPDYEKRIGRPLAMHTGIYTGLVVTGEVNLEKGTHGVVGDTVNTAARLSGLAKPGEIVVGHDTYQRVKGHFNFEPLAPVTVKGKSEPVQVYRLTGTKESPERSIGISSPLVGREKELNRLELQIHRLINGTGGIVTITGEAGIGKSRLMAELHRSAAVKKTMFLEGRALSIGRSLSFYPIIDALKHWSRIREEDTDSEAQRKLEKAIRMIHPEEVNEVFPFIAILMGMKLTGKNAQRLKGIEGEALEKLIFKNMRELIIKGSEVRPTVIYIEDFHWVDTSSLELIEALFRLVEAHRVLFILVFRPGYADTGERIVKSIRENYPTHWTKIDLDPLSDAESDTLLSNLLQIRGLPHNLRDQILQRAGGNPFFLEEVVRSFIDEGAVVLEKGEYRVTDRIKQVVIPQSIHALIMTRIDRLDEATRNLVRVASVIGRNFFYRILTEVASNIDEIDRRLGHLKEIQLIRERKRMEELEYLFKHALAQEAAYESILIQRRKEIHQKVARSIEKVFQDRLHDFYGMLAYHYSMGEDLDKAEDYMIKAGEEAMKSAASSEALGYFEEALSIYRSKFGEKASPEKIAMLEKNIAYTLLNKGEQLKAADYFAKVLEYHGEVCPRTAVGIALKCGNGFLQLLTGIYLPRLKWKRIPDEKDKEIIELQYAKALALTTSVPKRFVIETFFMLPRFTAIDISRIEKGFGKLATTSSLFSWSGISATISRKILTFTADKIGANDDESHYAWLVIEIAHKIMIDDFNLSHIDIVSFNTLTEKMLKLGAFLEVIHGVVMFGFFLIKRGDFEKAGEMESLLSRIGAEYEHDHAKVYQLLLEVRISREQGRLTEAIDAARRGIVLAERLGLSNIHLEFLALKARAHVLLGDQEGSETCIKHQEEIQSNNYLNPYYLSDYVASRSMYSISCLEEAVNNGDKPRIDQFARESWKWGMQATKVSDKIKRDRVEILRLMGIRSWLMGERGKALKWWGDSVETGERLKMRPDLSRTYFEIGKRLSEPKSPYKELNGITAAEYLNKARTMFEEMNLQWDLEQLEHVVT